MFNILTTTKSDGSMSFGSKLGSENIARFLSHNNIDFNNLVYMEQVHDAKVEIVNLPGLKVGTDGIICTNNNLIAMVFHADCIPIYLYINDNPIFGACHAGWKGIREGIIENTVSKLLQSVDAVVTDINVVSGPFICPKHYNIAIDDERVKYFPVIKLNDNEVGIDLKKEVSNRFLKSGVKQEYIKFSDKCTACNSNEYWSRHVDYSDKSLMATFGYHS